MNSKDVPEIEIKKAADILKAGGLVALPTETVYGLGADARQNEAVKRIFAVKGRPGFNPLIVHVLGLAEACEIGEFDDVSLQLALKFWPGPLTIIVPLKLDAGISPFVSAGLSTVALRVPAHEISRSILRASGLAIAAPSANSSGKISPTTHLHVLHDLGAKVDMIVEGGETERGLESTIVKVEKKPDTQQPFLVLLRPGPVTIDELKNAAGLEVVCPLMAIEENEVEDMLSVSVAEGTPKDQTIAHSVTDTVTHSIVHSMVPGALLRHYAPRACVRLNALDVLPGEGVLGFGGEESSFSEGEFRDVPFYNLSKTGDLNEAAHRLFAGLHWMDEQGVSGIAVRPIPDEGVGLALNDRLQRAAAGSAK